MNIICLDLEGVLVPEIWIAVAERTGVEALRATTRDLPDYDELMRHRLRFLDEHGIRLPDIQAVVADMEPCPGTVEFLEHLHARYQVVVVSDTYYEFATPLMAQLDWPTLFCNHVVSDGDGRIIGYQLREPDQKRAVVRAFRGMNFKVIAAGDSHNDLSMLQEADAGILFGPPDSISAEHPQFPVVTTFEALEDAIDNAIDSLGA